MVLVEVMAHGVGSNRAVRGPIGGGTTREQKIPKKGNGKVGPQYGAMYLTGKLWSGLILSNKLYSCKGNVSWDHSAFLNVGVLPQIC